jgi:hypothetical protein
VYYFKGYIQRGKTMRAMQNILGFALGILIAVVLPFQVIAQSEVPGSFTVQLTISNVAVSDTGVSYATISWKTNSGATSRVFYDTRSHTKIDEYAYQKGDESNLVTNHSIDLTGLSRSTIYYYRIKSVAIVNTVEFIAVSGEYDFGTGGRSGGGNTHGSNNVPLELEEDAGITGSTIRIDSDGIVQTGGRLTTIDGRLIFTINTGTRMLDKAGRPIMTITSVIPIAAFSPPLQSATVLAYDLGPDGASFTPPITITINYKSLALPPGVSESTLYIAYRDGSEWQALQSSVDTEFKTVSAFISHFTVFALIGEFIPAPSPSPTVSPTLTPTPMPTSTSTPTSTPQITTTTTPIPTPAVKPSSTPASSLPPLQTFTPTPTPVPAPTTTPGFLNNWWWVIVIIAAVVLIVFILWFVFKRRKR